MFEVTILIPVRDNAGVTFSSEDHAVFEGFLVERCGAFTLLPYTSTGAWADAGVLYRDDARLYVVAIESIAFGDRIGAVAAMAKVLYRQRAIYVRYLGLAEVL